MFFIYLCMLCVYIVFIIYVLFICCFCKFYLVGLMLMLFSFLPFFICARPTSAKCKLMDSNENLTYIS
jgi:hypothetical protein